MTALALSVFVAALLGSVHCAGMCGSFACLASGGDASSGRSALRSTVTYNLGRLVSYAILGAVAGAAGAGLDQLGAVAGITRPAAIVAGVLLIMWGLATLLGTFGVRLPAVAVPPALASRIARGVRAVQQRPPAVRGLAIGMLTAALPCGWLYAFVATSAAAGSALGGAVVMAAFWIGTVPMMTAVGLGAQRLLGPARKHLPALTAAMLVVLGGLTVAGRFAPAAHAAGAAADARGLHDHR
ncbi:MAG: sulfite exporter TauE/SafE family protein [Gemmatimonadetes bacterium]|nr:sulfite exporter TauE/SafE family protein [Gemmatimonadota bacterium]MBP7549802.1 sulfite exporter TauE/SafE family protein [Gemmatimonadaceae bacterium]